MDAESATPGPPATGPEAVHFSRRSKRRSKVEQYVRQWTMFSLMGVGGLLVSMSLLLARFILPAGPKVRNLWVLLIVPAAVGTAGIVVGARQWRIRKRWKTESQALPAEPDEAFRVRCVGSPDEINAQGGLQNVPFEPGVWWASLSVPPTGWALALIWIVAVILGLGASVGTRWFTVRRWTGDPGPFDIWAAYGVCWAVYAWLRPMYYRVVPGRLDVLRYSTFRTQPTQVQRYDLRAARVLIDLRRSLVCIDTPAGGVELSFAVLAGRRRFAYLVLLGALSTHPPGPLPEDELVG